MKVFDRLRAFWRIKNLLDLVIMGKGVNHHHTIEYKGQDSIKFNNFTYRLNLSYVFMRQRTFFSKLRDRIKRRKHYFCLYFLEKKKDPISIDQQEKPKLTSEVLDIAKRSTALSKALSELFRGQISGRTIVFVLVAVIVIGLVYLVMTGGITLPEGLLPNS